MLSEREQLLAGNAFVRRLAQQTDSDPVLGRRKVIRLMDAGKKLSEYFDVDLASLLPPADRRTTIEVGHPALSDDRE